MKLRQLLLLMLTITSFFWVATVEAANSKLTVLFTGETHSYLYPCECPHNPTGGLARRSTVIKKLRQENKATLVLDAGGFFAGGKYDEKTGGVVADRLRNEVNLAAMEEIPYDVAALGDDEFSFGLEYLKSIISASSVSFISANTFDSDNKLIGKPFLVKEYQGVKVGILGLMTPELTSGEFAAKAAGVTVTDPLEEAEKIIPFLEKRVDILIVLSHLGEEKTKEVANKFKGIDLIINAHRKVSTTPFSRINDVTLAQFNFQGRKLGKIDFILNEDKEIEDVIATEVDLGVDVADDPAINKLLLDFERNKKDSINKLVVDLYVMSNCPYGLEAENNLFPIIKQLGNAVDFNLYYLIQQNKEGFTSLHGEPELKENSRQLALSKLFADKMLDYISCYNENQDPDEANRCLEDLGISPVVIDGYASSPQIKSILNQHLARSERLAVTASPTMYINNRRYQGGFSAVELKKTFCGYLTDAQKEGLELCRDVPKCLTDSDCSKPGQLGICVNAGEANAVCEYRSALEFNHQVIYSADCLTCNQDEVVSSTKALFPGAKVELLESESSRARELMERYQIERLPAYLFENKVKLTYRFEEVKNSFLRKDDRLIINPDLVGASYFIKREKKKARLDIIMAELSPQAQVVSKEIISFLAEGSPEVALEFHVQAFLDENGLPAALSGLREEESARRTLVIKERYPDRFLEYLSIRNVSSSYWQDPIRKLGLDPEEIRTLAQGELGQKLFQREAEFAHGLPMEADLVFLVNNRELAKIKNLEDLRLLINNLAEKTVPPDASEQKEP